MTRRFETQLLRDGDAIVVAVAGDVDLETAPALWTALEPVLMSADRLVLDLSQVTFIDSSGLGVLVRASQLLGRREALVVRSPQPQARRVFQLAGIDQVVTVEDGDGLGA